MANENKMNIIEALVQLRDDLKLWVANNLRTKVDKEDGKGLSSNDFTSEEKEKLADLAAYTIPTASANVLGGIKVGSGLAINDGVLSVNGELSGGDVTGDAVVNVTGENNKVTVTKARGDTTSFDINNVVTINISSLAQGATEFTPEQANLIKAAIEKIEQITSPVVMLANGNDIYPVIYHKDDEYFYIKAFIPVESDKALALYTICYNLAADAIDVDNTEYIYLGDSGDWMQSLGTDTDGNQVLDNITSEDIQWIIDELHSYPHSLVKNSSLGVLLEKLKQYIDAQKSAITDDVGIQNSSLDELVIIDKASNIIARIDSEGLTTTKATVDEAIISGITIDANIARNRILDYIEYTVNNGEVTINSCNTAISGSYVIPDVIEGYPVTSIDSYAFSVCDGLTSITIPDSVASIGSAAFYDCSNLKSINIPDNVTSISTHTVQNCTSLSSINIPNSVTSIGDSAFSGCSSLTEIAIPDSVMSIGGYAFYNCTSLSSITIPDRITSVVDGTFYRCDCLSSITIPDSVTSIGTSAFSGCYSLTDLYYKGSEEAWSRIEIDEYNDALLNATIHYNQSYATKEYVNNRTLTGKYTATFKMFLEPSVEEADEIAAKIAKHVIQEDIIPADKLPLYDFNSNGRLESGDESLVVLMAQEHTFSDWEGAIESDVTLTIDPTVPDKLIKISGTDMWGYYKEHYISADVPKSTFATKEQVKKAASNASKSAQTRLIWQGVYSSSDDTSITTEAVARYTTNINANIIIMGSAASEAANSSIVIPMHWIRPDGSHTQQNYTLSSNGKTLKFYVTPSYSSDGIALIIGMIDNEYSGNIKAVYITSGGDFDCENLI